MIKIMKLFLKPFPNKWSSYAYVFDLPIPKSNINSYIT